MIVVDVKCLGRFLHALNDVKSGTIMNQYVSCAVIMFAPFFLIMVFPVGVPRQRFLWTFPKRSEPESATELNTHVTT